MTSSGAAADGGWLCLSRDFCMRVGRQGSEGDGERTYGFARLRPNTQMLASFFMDVACGRLAKKSLALLARRSALRVGRPCASVNSF